MKKTFAMITTVALGAGLLAGCGANGNNTEGNTGAGNGGGKENEKVTLSVWGMGEEAKTLPKLAEQFTKENPNITINVQALPWNQGHEKLLTAIASKKGPDVIQMGTSWI